MRPIRSLAPTCLALALAGGLHAQALSTDLDYIREELPFVDVRLGIGLLNLPTEWEMQAGGTGGSFTYTDRFADDPALNVTYSIVGGLLNPVGMLYGGEITYVQTDMQLESRTVGGVVTPTPAAAHTLQYRHIGLNYLMGPGLAMGEHLHLEVLGLIGLGAVDISFAAPGQTDAVNGGGWYWNGGVRGGLYFTWRRLTLGASADFLYLDIDAAQDDAVNDVNVDLEEAVWAARLEIGYHIP